MRSLKASLPEIGGILGMTADELYTRQRAVVAHAPGLLTYREGRGPGSGTPLTAETLAVIVVAAMIGPVSDVATWVRHICTASIVRRHPWHKVEEVTFLDSFAKALQTGKVRRRPLRGVRISKWWRAQLVGGIDGLKTVDYLVDKEYLAKRDVSVIRTTVELDDTEAYALHRFYIETCGED